MLLHKRRSLSHASLSRSSFPLVGRERPIDLLVKSLRMADNKVFDDPLLLPHSADIFVQRVPIEDLKDLLVQAEQQHEICKVAAETFEEEYVEQATSWAKALETEDSYGDSTEALPREALVRHLKFWAALLLIGTVRLYIRSRR